MKFVTTEFKSGGLHEKHFTSLHATSLCFVHFTLYHFAVLYIR